MFLRLFCHLYEIVGDKIWKLVESTANMYNELLNCQHNCAHKGSQLDENVFLTKLSKLAYNKTIEGSIVITQEDLSECQIAPNEVRDLLIGVHGKLNCALIGQSLFYFAHQSMQVSRFSIVIKY